MWTQAPDAPKLRDSKAGSPTAESATTSISRSFHTGWTLFRPSCRAVAMPADAPKRPLIAFVTAFVTTFILV